MKKATSGFTIVELLIVIVVIAVLAAISVVAYTGIQNRANDAAIVNDLAILKKKIELSKIDNAELYPNGSISSLNALGFKMTKSAYASMPTTENNFWYCRSSGQVRYGVVALSKSGSIFYISDLDNPTKYTGAWTWVGTHHNCNQVIHSSLGWQYAGYASEDTTIGPYRAWVGGN